MALCVTLSPRLAQCPIVARTYGQNLACMQALAVAQHDICRRSFADIPPVLLHPAGDRVRTRRRAQPTTTRSATQCQGRQRSFLLQGMRILADRLSRTLTEMQLSSHSQHGLDAERSRDTLRSIAQAGSRYASFLFYSLACACSQVPAAVYPFHIGCIADLGPDIQQLDHPPEAHGACGWAVHGEVLHAGMPVVGMRASKTTRQQS